MLITTKGIVLKITKYRETSIIANIYTEELGLNSYIVNGVRAAKGRNKIGYYEPLNLLEITAYHKPGRNIERITEVKSAYPIHNIRQDVYKSAMSMFLVELLNKCIVERDSNKPLFTFLYDAIIALDQIKKNNSFHLQFMLSLTSFLGFGIHDPNTFIEQSNNRPFYKDLGSKQILRELLESDFSHEPSLSPEQRQTILDDILYYYQYHLEIPKLKSLKVLHTIFK